MKILVANKYFYLKGGSEHVFFDTAELLKKNGHKVCFFSMKHPENIPTAFEKYFVENIDYEDSGVRHRINAALKLLYSREARKKMKKLILDEKPDIAHLHNIHHQISPSILHELKKSHIPVVMTLHDFKMVCANYSLHAGGKKCQSCKNGKYYNCFLKQCIKSSYAKSLLGMAEMYFHHSILKIYDLVDIFIAPSQFLKDKLTEMGFKNKITVLPNFFDYKETDGAAKSGEDYAVYFGRLSEDKGLMVLLDAIRGIPVQLKIFGEGPLKENLLARIRDKKIENVKLFGYKNKEELAGEISNSLFTVMPSCSYENNPRSIIESFAMGKPVVASSIGGIPEMVKDNLTGLTFQPGDRDDLERALRAMIQDREKIAQMGRQARIFYNEKFTAGRHYESLLGIYRSAMGA